MIASRALPGPPLLLLAASLLLAGGASAQLPVQVPAGTHAVEYRHALPADGFLRLWNMSGSVEVVAWDQDSVVVSGDVANGLPFSCGGGTRGIKCATDVPPSEGDSARAAHLLVRVPRAASVWVKSNTADITLRDATGNLEAYSVTGAIRVSGRAHALQVETMGGDIEVRGSAASLRARTADGAIRLAADADEVDVSSVTGAVTIAAGGIRHGRVESIDGPVRWHAPLAEGARLDLSSHGGAIDVRLPAGTGGIFTLSSFGGRIACPAAGARRTVRAESGTTACIVPPTRDARVLVRSFKGAITIERP